ncbi:uncharacterized protein LOC124841102 [Vigna umbellata]|uniref:uncharacterized protein LOC124841102 n=1 Tax=Vigna umbellata TaxID=87088 RepID=UPI001F5E6B5B|nr:uncharacterized protein LOC124841102 [Vigna umbellata]
MEGFSKIVGSLTQLTRKDQLFVWTDKYETIFEEMKKMLTFALVLVIPNTEKVFEVYYDASYQVLGCVLMQERKLVAYASRQLKTNGEKQCRALVDYMKSRSGSFYNLEILADFAGIQRFVIGFHQ